MYDQLVAPGSVDYWPRDGHLVAVGVRRDDNLVCLRRRQLAVAHAAVERVAAVVGVGTGSKEQGANGCGHEPFCRLAC